MLITFRSRTGQSVPMFESPAKTLLKRMGHSDTVPGAILSAEIQGYLTTLEHALKLEASSNDNSDEDKDFIDEAVSLNQRAFPLLELMRYAVKKDENLMWDQD